MPSPPSKPAPLLRRLKAGLASRLPKGVLDHYYAMRAFDLATLRRNRALGPPADGLPLPNATRLVATTGTADIAWFLGSGQKAFEAIEASLGRHGVPLDQLDSILDFGCGCGRVVRHWRRAPHVAVHGCDYDPRSLAWCRDHLDFASFARNQLAPPLPYDDDTFDLVYALSVFTHLPEELQHAWLDELARVLRPGGHLLVTTHGDHYLGRLSGEERARYDAGDLVVVNSTQPGTNYCAAYHPSAYWPRVAAGTFDVLEHVPEGALGNPQQDLWLLRRR